MKTFEPLSSTQFRRIAIGIVAAVLVSVLYLWLDYTSPLAIGLRAGEFQLN